MDLEVAGTDRDFDAISVSARVGQRLRHGGLCRAEEAQHTADRKGRRSQHALDGLASREPAATAGGARAAAREARRRRTVRIEHEAGSGSGQPSEIAPSGTVACFRTPVSKSAYGRPRRSAITARSPRSGPRDLVDTSGAPATCATSSTVRSSCVARARPRRDRCPRLSPRATRTRVRPGRSPTIVIRTGSRPSRARSRRRMGR